MIQCFSCVFLSIFQCMLIFGTFVLWILHHDVFYSDGKGNFESQSREDIFWGKYQLPLFTSFCLQFRLDILFDSREALIFFVGIDNVYVNNISFLRASWTSSEKLKWRPRRISSTAPQEECAVIFAWRLTEESLGKKLSVRKILHLLQECKGPDFMYRR